MKLVFVLISFSIRHKFNQELFPSNMLYQALPLVPLTINYAFEFHEEIQKCEQNAINQDETDDSYLPPSYLTESSSKL